MHTSGLYQFTINVHEVLFYKLWGASLYAEMMIIYLHVLPIQYIMFLSYLVIQHKVSVWDSRNRVIRIKNTMIACLANTDIIGFVINLEYTIQWGYMYMQLSSLTRKFSKFVGYTYLFIPGNVNCPSKTIFVATTSPSVPHILVSVNKITAPIHVYLLRYTVIFHK